MAADPEELRVLAWFLRGLCNSSQREMGAAARISPSTLSRYETGEVVPSRASLERLADAAGVPFPLVEAVLLPAIGSALRARAMKRQPEKGSYPSVEETTDPLAAAVTATMRATFAAFGEELGGASPSVERVVRPIAEEETRRADRAAVERLGAESVRTAAGDAAEALELASLALRIAEASPGDAAWQAGLKSCALAYLANARRVGADLEGATAAFAEAWRLRGESGALGAELLPEWRLLDLEASLLRDRRRCDEA